MALNNLGLGFLFTARDTASSVMTRVGSRFETLGRVTDRAAARVTKNIGIFESGLATFGAGVGTLGGAFAFAGKAGEFEQALAGVGAVANATAGQFALLEARAIQAGLATQFSPTEAVAGLRNLTQAGLQVKDAVDALVPALNLSAAALGKVGVAEAAQLVTQSMRAFGVEADRTGLAVDQMVVTTSSLGISLDELALSLGIASRGAIATGQSLDETLVSLGLIKSVVPSVERSATSLAVAMERLAKPETQKELKKLRVAVTDAGEFRDFLTIVNELTAKTATMTEVERAAFIQRVFGAEASAGLLAVMAQLTNGIPTTTGELVKGAEAVAFLRSTMDTAGGAAEKFSQRLLDTFQGQVTLLRGTLDTLAVVVGQSFTRVLEPVVAAIKAGLNAVIGLVRSVPEPIRTGLAGIVLAVGAFLTFAGAVLVTKAAFALLSVGIKLAVGVMASFLATLLPAVLVLALVVPAIAGIVVAIKNQFAGIGAFFSELFQRIRLFLRAMVQLVTQGGFSGAVREELGKAENQGLKRFAIGVFQVLFRIRRFFTGVVDGVASVLGPLFGRLASAFVRLGQAFGSLDARVQRVAGLASDRFANSGAIIGKVLGHLLGLAVRVVTAVVDLAAGIVAGFRSMAGVLGTVFGFIRESLGELIAAFAEIGTAMGLTADTTESTGDTLVAIGRVIGRILGAVVGTVGLALAGLVRIVTAVVRVFRVVGDNLGRMAAGLVQLFTDPVEGIENLFFGLHDLVAGTVDAILRIFGITLAELDQRVIALWNRIARGFRSVVGSLGSMVQSVVDAFVRAGRQIAGVFTETIPSAFRAVVDAIQGFLAPIVDVIRGIFDSIANAIDEMLAFAGRVVSRIPGRFRPGFLDTVVDAGQAAQRRIDERGIRGETVFAPEQPPVRPSPRTAVESFIPPALLGPSPAAVVAEGQRATDDRLVTLLAENTSRTADALEATANRPIQVRMEVDGDVLAEHTVSATRRQRARSFGPP